MTRVYSERPRKTGKTMRTALGNVYRLPVGEFSTKLSSLPRPAATPPAKAAKFAPDPQRRVMIAKIKIASKALDFDDGDYRALLERVTGKVSATAMSIGELGQVLDEFARLGWRPANAGKHHAPRPADHPGAKKARALWISLSLLGVIRQPSEAALEAFARRQLGCAKLQWADQSQVYKLIEALKKIAESHGWEQSVAGLDAPIWTLKLRLCEAILRRAIAAGAVEPGMSLARVIFLRLGLDGPLQAVTERGLEDIATHLGAMLARAAHAAHYED